MTYLKTCLAAAIAASAMIAAPANAWDKTNAPVTTTIDARDLQTDSGIAKVHADLTRKAERSCAVSGQQSVKTRLQAKACAETMLSKFVDNVDHSALTSYHEMVTQKV